MYGTFDNLCACDRVAWPGEAPRYADLADSAAICATCLGEVIHFGSRWSPYHCRPCMRDVQALNATFQYPYIPIGPHSIMNQLSLGGVPTEAQLISFFDQFSAMCLSHRALYEIREERTRRRAADLGLEGPGVLAAAFVAANPDRAAGLNELIECVVAREGRATTDTEPRATDDGA